MSDPDRNGGKKLDVRDFRFLAYRQISDMVQRTLSATFRGREGA